MPSTDPFTNKARNARWCAANRNCTRPRPWLAGAPPFAMHLPGGFTTVSFSPAPRWPMALRNARGLHGAITHLRDGIHGRWANWALIPYRDGWGVYWSSTEEAAMWAMRTVNGALWDRPTAFRLGPLVRMRAPVGLRRGHQRVRVDALTPIVTRSMGGTNPCTCPTTDTIRGCLSGELLYRLSPSHRKDSPGQDVWTQWVKPRVQVELVERHTEPVHTLMGGKYGRVSGWQGHVVLEVNAVARWLLVACERGIGFGGRTAFGFGRIRITEAP